MQRVFENHCFELEEHSQPLSNYIYCRLGLSIFQIGRGTYSYVYNNDKEEFSLLALSFHVDPFMLYGYEIIVIIIWIYKLLL